MLRRLDTLQVRKQFTLHVTLSSSTVPSNIQVCYFEFTSISALPLAPNIAEVYVDFEVYTPLEILLTFQMQNAAEIIYARPAHSVISSTL